MLNIEQNLENILLYRPNWSLRKNYNEKCTTKK